MEELLKLACNHGLALLIAIWAIFRLDRFLSKLHSAITQYNSELANLRTTLIQIQQTLEIFCKK